MATFYEPSSLPAVQDDSESMLDQHQSRASTSLSKRFFRLARPDRRERRKEARYITNQEAVLTEVNPITFGSTSVRVQDVSRHGLKIHVSRELYPGATVYVRVGEIVVTAEVRHCADVVGGYEAGMAILDVIPHYKSAALFEAFSSSTAPDAG